MKKNGFCTFYKNLYFGESVKKHSLVKWKLYHGSGQLTIFCLVRAMSDNDQLDIIHSAFLKQPYYREHPAYIYGIAGSYAEALAMVVDISDRACKAGMDGKLVEFLDKDA
ncbi:hypothetical protein D6853_03115 [Butyrivibrio sp. X503]|uniref:hypothetical protein n=1 Tax=Butyrivibrio sp. X503 TaxID=2364878 RepID=UPI000EA9F64A|nr:hypothetical protein [Butyrivibrio sp. X503]RKM57023.1 hypothetical protein D6853_03115 [Butyrivibrio sp. X503]